MKTWTSMQVTVVGKVTDVVMGGQNYSGGGGSSYGSYSNGSHSNGSGWNGWPKKWW